MSVSFSYQTHETVPTEIKNIIHNEADKIKRRWVTTEKLNFFQVEGSEEYLHGDSKIFPDALAEYRPVPGKTSDARFIVEKLAEWSARFKLTWHITAQGAKVGKIRTGKPDAKVMGMVETFENPKLWQFNL